MQHEYSAISTLYTSSFARLSNVRGCLIAWAPVRALQAGGGQEPRGCCALASGRTFPRRSRSRFALRLAQPARAAKPPAPDHSAIYLYKGTDRVERLTAKAREEGTLTVYTSMSTTEFGSACPGLREEIRRQGPALAGAERERAAARAHRGARRPPRPGRDRDQRARDRGAGARAGGGAIRHPPPCRSAGLGDPVAPALAQRPRQSVGHRLQHRQGQARGAAGDARRLRRCEMERAARARGHRRRLDVRRHQLHGRGARIGFLPQARGAQARHAQGPYPGGAADRGRRIGGVADGL